MCINTIRRSRAAGVSLVETMIFIVIMGVGVAALATLMQSTVRNSSDPLIQKQMMAIAEALLEEVMSQPFTDCDPAAYDADTNNCTQAEASGADTVGAVLQTRYSQTTPFNNVNDYHGFSMTGIRSIDDTAIPGLESYTASVSVSNAGTHFTVGAPSDPAHALHIQVTVSDPAGQTYTLSGYRFRHTPRP